MIHVIYLLGIFTFLLFFQVLLHQCLCNRILVLYLLVFIEIIVYIFVHIYIQGKRYLRRTCILHCELECNYKHTFSLNIVLLLNAFSIFISNRDVINKLRPK